VQHSPCQMRIHLLARHLVPGVVVHSQTRPVLQAALPSQAEDVSSYCIMRVLRNRSLQ
jgi:hypothetical protein